MSHIDPHHDPENVKEEDVDSRAHELEEQHEEYMTREIDRYITTRE